MKVTVGVKPRLSIGRQFDPRSSPATETSTGFVLVPDFFFPPQ